MDITAQIRLAQFSGSTVYPGTFTTGDIVKICPREEIKEPPSKKSKLAFIHISGADFANIEEAEILFNPYLDEQEDAAELLKARRYFFDLTLLQHELLNELSDNCEVSINWQVAKSLITDKKDNLLMFGE